MRCRKTMFWQTAGGFTLVEVLVSVVVAALVFVAFLGLQTLGIRTRVHARLASKALNAAEDFLEQILVSVAQEPSNPAEALEDSGFLEPERAMGSEEDFSKRWEVRWGEPAPNLVTVRVLLCWTEPGKPPPTQAHCDFPHPTAPHVALEGVAYRP